MYVCVCVGGGGGGGGTVLTLMIIIAYLIKSPFHPSFISLDSVHEPEMSISLLFDLLAQ